MAMTTPTAYSWLKEYLGDTKLSPQEIADLLGGHAFEIEDIYKVGDEDVIDVDILPNRSSDCLCHRGIAREVASLHNVSLFNDPLATKLDLPATDKITVTIEDDSACRRFGTALITGVKIGESPVWLKQRLEAIGQRSINNVVDATNYVMFSIGQPLHAYDAGKFPQTDGTWRFGVRFATAGEKITVLTGEEFECNEGVQLIVDTSSDTPAGIAGIKGGKYAEVDSSTATIILEAANFDPIVTRKASTFLRLKTDASKRFENEVSPDVIPYALYECAELIKEIASGTIEGYMIEDRLPSKKPAPIAVSLERINALLGLSLTSDTVLSIFKRLGISASFEGDTFSCVGPWERTDLNIEEDFIEEVGRVYGYDHVESVVPKTVTLAEMNVRHYYSEAVRELLIERGFSEVITSSFRKKDQIQLKNALASDKSYLRSNLTKNLTEVLDQNATRADLFGTADTRVFELGTVFEKGEEAVQEHVSLAIGVRLKAAYSGKEDKLLKEVLEAIEAKLDTKIDWQIEKGIAECNFTNVFVNLPKPAQYDPVTVAEEIVYQPFSTYPHVSRDIALWVGEGTATAEVEAVLNDHAGDLRVRTDLFDEFTKDGRTSYAFRLVFQSNEKTLTDSEVNVIMDDINTAVAKAGWEVR